LYRKPVRTASGPTEGEMSNSASLTTTGNDLAAAGIFADFGDLGKEILRFGWFCVIMIT
jgi:hypothetical protein